MLVSGPWDFAGILLAASGFLLFGGPALIVSFDHTTVWRFEWLLGDKNASEAEILTTGRIIFFGLYFVFVVGTVALILYLRRRLTVVYNVDPLLVEQVLSQLLQEKQLHCSQASNVLVIDSPGASNPLLGNGPVTVEVEVSEQLCHVSLRWTPADSLLRREAETRLRAALTRAAAPGGHVGDWLLIISTLLSFALLVGLAILILLRLFRP
jgi:hypothetical protein